MTIAIKNQVIREIRFAAFGLFLIQLNESTDIASYVQLLVFARYVHSDLFKIEFLSLSSSNHYKGHRFFAKTAGNLPTEHQL